MTDRELLVAASSKGTEITLYLHTSLLPSLSLSPISLLAGQEHATAAGAKISSLSSPS